MMKKNLLFYLSLFLLWGGGNDVKLINVKRRASFVFFKKSRVGQMTKNPPIKFTQENQKLSFHFDWLVFTPSVEETLFFLIFRFTCTLAISGY